MATKFRIGDLVYSKIEKKVGEIQGIYEFDEPECETTVRTDVWGMCPIDSIVKFQYKLHRQRLHKPENTLEETGEKLSKYSGITYGGSLVHHNRLITKVRNDYLMPLGAFHALEHDVQRFKNMPFCHYSLASFVNDWQKMSAKRRDDEIENSVTDIKIIRYTWKNGQYKTKIEYKASSWEKFNDSYYSKIFYRKYGF